MKLKSNEKNLKEGGLKMDSRKLLCYLAIKYQGDWNKILQAIKEKERVEEKDVLEATSAIQTDFITIIDEDYPESLKRMHQPPIVLFFKGDKTLLNQKRCRLAVIGARDVSEYGKEVTTNLLTELLKNDDCSKTIVVSGLARGVDTVAHQTTLNNNGATIAVLGSAINRPYPSSNKKLLNDIINSGGLVISEYPDGVDPEKDHFPMRNRIVAGLADSILVTEAHVSSGTNITVMFALQEGKDVMAVPRDITYEGNLCNKLIRDGALVVTSSDDLIFNVKDITSKK